MKLRSLVYACALFPVGLHAQLSVDFPLGVGIHTPAYDRVDGLSLPYGPDISVGENRFTIEPLLTYRSHIGKVDPLLSFAWQLDSAVTFSVSGTRGTFSNDSWIRSDLINSVYALFLGIDARNYFRADRGEGIVTVTLSTTENNVLHLHAGTRFENAWSTGWRLGERQGPFSFYRQHDTINGMERANPLINEGHIASALVGGDGHYENEKVSGTVSLGYEGAWHTPSATHFQQLTLHEEGFVRTWGGQRIELITHLLATNGSAPAQRYGYLGGSGTLATVDLFPLGGDHLYFLDALYLVPLPGIDLPFLDRPFIAPHFASGAAAVGGFGAPIQNVGLRLGAGLIRLDFLVNPRTHTRDFGYGFSFSR